MATKYDIVTTARRIKPMSLELFIDGLRHGIRVSKYKYRAVFIDETDVVHAMSLGSEFNRLCKSADLVGIYQKGFNADDLREDLNSTLGGH